ncbi:MAG: hypothetical protein ACRD0A_20750 [Acidimicrobiales bacterium]
MSLPHDRPEILAPPPGPPRCCTQQTLTVPPDINAKTTQKHDYPSAAHRASYRRRTGSERAFSTVKDPATTDTRRGWCRLMGVTDDARRLATGRPPKTRRRRRRTLADLVDAKPP